MTRSAPYRSPLRVAGREFASGCRLELEIQVALPERQGVPVEPLVGALSFVRRPAVWGQYFRAGLVRLGPDDLELLRSAVIRAAV